jgi:sulfate adenylyltransferase (ADP) / ATP adenylyltransferase
LPRFYAKNNTKYQVSLNPLAMTCSPSQHSLVDSQLVIAMGSTSSDAMKLGLSEPLRTLVQRKFVRARSAGDLLFSDTELAILRSRHGVQFQLRYCEALSAKPKEKIPDWSKPKSKVDPFENPSSELLVARIPRDKCTHNLVLNKFPVIPNHFIIATRDSRPQTDILEENDLAATYACVQAWEEGSEARENEGLFAFFNSGDHSGASQIHRHLQFLPIKDMLLGSTTDNRWALLVHSMTAKAHPKLPLLYNPSVPFIHFAVKLEPHVSAASLHAKYIMLMKAALSASTTHARSRGEESERQEIERDGRTTFSYNLALTTDTMAICPRRCETAQIPGLDESHDVSINGTILGGTLMVKNVTEWHTMLENPHVLDDLIASVGFPWPPEHFDTSSNRL